MMAYLSAIALVGDERVRELAWYGTNVRHCAEECGDLFGK